MAWYNGPCNRCGAHVDRRIKPGKEEICLECALRKMLEQQHGYANGTDPRLAKSVEAGRKTADALRTRSGPMWERWAASVTRYLDEGSTTQGETSDTFPA